MESITIDAFLSTLIPLLLYFIVTLTGALLKDQLNKIVKKDATFRLNRILIGSICGAFIMIGAESLLVSKFTMSQILCIAFISGTISFDIFEYVSKIENIKLILQKYGEVKEVLKTPTNQDKENNDNNGGQ